MPRKACIQPSVTATSSDPAVHNSQMVKTRGSRINALASKLRAFKEGMRSQTPPRIAANMAGMVRVTGSTSSSLDMNNPQKSLAPLLCAANDHPLFVSDQDDVDDDDDVPLDDIQCEQLNSSKSETLHTDDLSFVDVEPELPPVKNDELPKSSPSDSFLDPGSDGPKLSSSSEGTSCGSVEFSNDAKSLSDPPVATNSLESSCEDASTNHVCQSESFESKPADRLECAPNGAAVKSNIPQDPALAEPATSKPIRRLEREKGKTSAQNVDSAKKSKVRPESSGNNLVFSYRKDADEVEIREIPSEDSRSSSDLDVDVPERTVEVQDDPAADLTSDDLSSSGSLHLAQSATDFATLNQHPAVAHKNSGGEIRKATGKKKHSTWGFVLNPNYKFRHDEFKRIFRNIPRSDRLVVDYSCALQRNILVQGRLYISQNWICFYACIFGVETTLSIEFKDIVQITKEKTARVFPNAIQISTKDEKHFISSLNARDKTYLIMSHFWKSANSPEPMLQEELWSWIHYSYGEDLGVSHEDHGYVPLSPEEKAKHMARIELEATLTQDLEGLGTADQSKDLPTEEGAGCEINSRKPVTESSSDANSISRGNSETNDSDSEIKCCGHDHLPIDVCDEVFNFPVDKLFQHCFSDSDAYRRFAAVKKTTDLVLSGWSENPSANGESVRNLTYTLSLVLAMTSKKAPATEKQTMLSVSKPGSIYVIDTECRTPTIPYGDSFYIVNRFCLTHVAESKSRLRITSQIVYQKNVFFKSFIEKNATSGILETFKIFVDILQKESSEPEGGVEHAVAPGGASTGKADQPVSKVHFVDSSQMWERITRNVGSVKFLSFWVLVMAIVMVVMLHRLWTSDSVDSTFGTCNMNLGDQEANDHEAIIQLQQQLQQQQIEIDRWKNELIHMIKTMDEFRQTMKDLLQRFE